MISRRSNMIAFVVYVTFIVLILVAALKCEAQTVDVYVTQFKMDASIYNRSLGPNDPKIVETSTPLYIEWEGRNTEVAAYNEPRTGTIYFHVNSNMYLDNLKVLTYHELGHYYLFRNHTTDNSIMNISIWTTTSWDDLSPTRQTTYIKELFK